MGAMDNNLAREYLRVSMDASGRMRSEDEQHEDNAGHAASEGWKLGAPYLENMAISASRYARKARAGFAALVDDVRSGQFRARYLILWESSRLSREVGEWNAFINDCEKAGVLIHVTTHGRTYDPANPRDRRSMLEDAVDSAYESDKASRRILRAMIANAADGVPQGRTPYGYRREYELGPRGKRVLKGQFPDDERGPDGRPAPADVVREIFDDVALGISIRAITASLNERRIPSPDGKSWGPTRVRAIAVNRAYARQRTHNGEFTAPGQWPALVGLEKFHAVRELLTDPRRRKSRAGRVKHLLSYLARCGECGGYMAVWEERGTRWYWCQEVKHVRISAGLLERYVSDLLVARLARPDVWPQVASASDGQVQAERDALAVLHARHADMIAAMAAGSMSVTAFTGAEPPVLADIAAAERRLAGLQVPAAVLMFMEAEVSAAQAWADATVPARRELIRSWLDFVLVTRVERGSAEVPVTERVIYRWRGDPGPSQR